MVEFYYTKNNDLIGSLRLLREIWVHVCVIFVTMSIRNNTEIIIA